MKSETVPPPLAQRELDNRHFPVSAGIFFGLGLGGVFDGIMLHQLLQWHHMLSSWYPVTSIETLELNTWDGIFHSATYIFVVIGLFLLWRTAQRPAIAQAASRMHAPRHATPALREEPSASPPGVLVQLASPSASKARAVQFRGRSPLSP